MDNPPFFMLFSMRITLPQATLERYISASILGEQADATLNQTYFLMDEEDRNKVAGYLSKGFSPSFAFRKVILQGADEETKSLISEVAKGFGLDEIKQLNPELYSQNEYAKRLLQKAEAHQGDIVFKKHTIAHHLPFLYTDKKVDVNDDYADVSPIGFFDKDFSFPSLDKLGRTWMSLVPHEIETMKQGIESAKGDIATLGLGLGYYAFMTSQKEDVNTVTIYELDQNVIGIFKSELLPLFDHPEKIRIRQGNALDYIKDRRYDYVYCDLWHDVEDGLPLYLRLKKKERANEPTAYWIEKDILVYLRRYLVALIEEENNGSTDADYDDQSSFANKVYAGLHKLLRNTIIADEEDLRILLSDASIRDLARRLGGLL